ncbi:uncharacterized protein LOC114349866 [Ostrinia furnacalis]|uniref:uncharacterized protein LOC114349866 n=1 Tax=Ostrinia furnacalis TaxID=93504 RepID=UPI00103D8612|nr:uncharacterized protein LOC114349866 [Ostrinia furnacalis]
MGTNSSKPHNEAAVHIHKNNDADVGDNFDPRSPTPEIVRTPLQGKGGSKHNITKNVDLRKTFENAKGDEKLIHNNPILSAVIKNHLQSYDPRSPSQDFERTPIVIASKIDEAASDQHMLRNKNEINCGSPCLRDDSDINDYSIDATRSPDLVVPKNLCDGFFDMTLNETIKETEEPLGSSTASNDAIQENISPGAERPTQLLETNFDYVETDSDKFEDSEENVMKKEEYSIDNLKGIPQFEILDDDPRSPSVGIERTPIVVSKTNLEESAEENVEEMSDDTLIKVLQSTNAELRQNIAKPEDKNSEGLMIYEDESLNDTPKKSKSTSNSGCRTPLSCMKNKTETGHTRSKSANTLYDPKNQKLVTKRASHIPRLKSLSKQTKLLTTGSTVSLKNISRASVISGDCENTPPHSHRDRWDKDSSIVL